MSQASSSSSASIKRLLAQADARRLLDALNTGGEEARIVGGAVRDAVMGRAPGDIDIGTTILPRAVMTSARRHGWKAVPTGIEHGTVTVVINHVPYEVTTLRRDVETDGRRAVVAFTRDFREDAFRRDFTINALSLSADGTVHDYATGIADAKAGLIRFMGDADTRIREDYLRILRFFRFFASHGSGEPDAAGLSACKALAPGMTRLSRERIRQELLKLLAARNAINAVSLMDDIALWPHLLPGITPAVPDFRRLVMLEAELVLPADAVLRLAALAGTDEALQEKLKLSNAEAERIARAVQGMRALGETQPTEVALRRLVFEHGSGGARDSLLLSGVIRDLPVELIQRQLQMAASIADDPPRNPFRSSDATAHGVPPGPRMGLVLKAALDLWLARGMPSGKDTHARILAEAVARHPANELD